MTETLFCVEIYSACESLLSNQFLIRVGGESCQGVSWSRGGMSPYGSHTKLARVDSLCKPCGSVCGEKKGCFKIGCLFCLQSLMQEFDQKAVAVVNGLLHNIKNWYLRE